MQHISKHLTVTQSSELAPQERRPQPLTSQEELLKVTLLFDPKLVKDSSKLPEVLLYVYHITGLKGENFPGGPERELLETLIVEMFGGHTAAEIKLAFLMAVEGRLNLESNEVEHYQNFSYKYFARIMAAYREWAKEAVQHVSEPPKALPPANDVTDEGFIQGVFVQYIASGSNMQTIPELAFKVLEEKLALTESDKQRIKKAVSYMLGSGADDAAKQLLRRQFAVAEYFDQMKYDEMSALYDRPTIKGGKTFNERLLSVGIKTETREIIEKNGRKIRMRFLVCMDKQIPQPNVMALEAAVKANFDLEI